MDLEYLASDLQTAVRLLDMNLLKFKYVYFFAP